MKMTTKIPPEITTPDSVETSLGTLKFFDGLPDQDTVQKVYDNLDRMRGVDVFLNTLAPASLLANIEGLKSVGCDNYSAVIHEDRVDAKTLLLTPRCQRPPSQHFTTRSLEKLFARYQQVKFFLTRDNIREVLVRR